MKRILSIILSILLLACTVLGFSSCSNNKNIDVALITTGNGVKNNSYDSLAFEGIKSYCKDKKLKSGYFDPNISDNGLTVDSIDEAIKNAVNANAKFIVLPGEAFAVSSYKLAPNYPDVSFILVNAMPHSEEDNILRVQQNVMCISFNALDVGYLNGYMDVVNGYDSLGYICELNSSNSGDYGSGYVTGASDACDKLNKKVTLNYANYNAVDVSYNYAIKLIPHYKNVDTEVENYSINASVDNFDKTFVIVQDGEGSGTYKAGDVVSISAEDNKDGNAFDHWSCEDFYGNEIKIDFDDATSSSTSFNMVDRFPSLVNYMAQNGVKSLFSGGNQRAISMYKGSGITDINLYSENVIDDIQPQIILDYGKAVKLALDDYKGGSFLQAGCENHCISSSAYSLNDKDKNYNAEYEKIYKMLSKKQVELKHVQSGGDIRKAVKTNILKLNYMINE